jgi:hypothetical protein
MTPNRTSDRQKETKQITDHPLADVAGKFGGELWEVTLEEIQRSRKREQQEIKKLLDSMPSE